MKPLRKSTMLADEHWALCSYCRRHTSNNWFDRTICPEPCGMMHTCCGHCGQPLDYCYWEHAA